MNVYTTMLSPDLLIQFSIIYYGCIAKVISDAQQDHQPSGLDLQFGARRVPGLNPGKGWFTKCTPYCLCIFMARDHGKDCASSTTKLVMSG